MAIYINTNLDSLKVQWGLAKATDAASLAMQRLTTGLRINSASDDPAGFVITKGIETQQRGSQIGIKNAQNGISILNSADGTLGKIQDHLMAMQDLALQALNGGKSPDELKALENEAQARALEIDRLSNGAKFNQFEVFGKNSAKTTETTFQVGANSSTENTIGVKGVFYSAETSTLTGLKAGQIKFSSEIREEIEKILDNLQNGIKEVSERRGIVGASIARLNSAVDILKEQDIHLNSALARIRDTDVAKESAQYTKQKILEEMTAALLVQANQAPSIALTLI